MNISLYLRNFHTFWHNRCDFLDEKWYFRNKLSWTLNIMSLKKPIYWKREKMFYSSILKRPSLVHCACLQIHCQQTSTPLWQNKEICWISQLLQDPVTWTNKGEAIELKEPGKMPASGQVYRVSTKVTNIAIMGCADFRCRCIHLFTNANFLNKHRLSTQAKPRWNKIKANNTKDFFK